MSSIDREIRETLGELVLVKRANAAMGTKNAGDKEALFKWLGAGADVLTGKAVRNLWPAAKAVGRFGRGAVKTPWNVAMELGGIRGLTREHELLQMLRGRKYNKAWGTVKGLADARGTKSPVGVFSALFNTMHTFSPRMSEAGKARWLLGTLNDPVKLKQFMVGATPAQRAALKKLAPMFGHASKAGNMSALAQWGAPAALIGGPLAYGAITSGDDSKSPMVTSVQRGVKSYEPPKEPNMLEKFWGDAGDRISSVAPGFGSAVKDHPYLSTAGAAGLAGAGLYGLLGGRGEEQP